MIFVKNTIDLFTMNYNNEDIPIKINNSSEKTTLNQNKSEINSQINNQRQLSIFEIFISKSFNLMTNFIQLIGPLFTYTITLFLLYTYISVIKTIIPEYKNQKKILLSQFISISTLIELFYILFNFFLATLIKPGSISDIINSKYYKKNNPYFSKDLIFPQMTFRINQNNRKNDKIWKKCKFCKLIKPLRTHHCSICNKCIFKMDHNCPWINNCVGQNNQRYFLLFLTHTFIYDIIIIISIIPLLLKGYFKNMENQLKFVIILSLASFIILFFFNSWNWFLALNGKTTLEFWGEKNGFLIEKIGPVNYNFGNWKKNLFYVFGCDNLFFIIFYPNIKKLPFSGLEWSKFVDDNFYVEGIDNFFEEKYDNLNCDDIEINVNI